MDSITQAVLGAAIGESMLGNQVGSKAAIAGAIIATIPDLDVLLYSVYSNYEMLSIHRGMSHSLFTTTLLSIIVAMILSKMKSFQSITKRKLVMFSWLCFITHIILDAFTAYGTQLLAPLSDRRFGLDCINVVDPVYTLPMLIGLMLSLWFFRSKKNRTSFSRWGLIASSAYLAFTLIHKEIVSTAVVHKLNEDHIEFAELLTMPVGIANLNWYGVAKSQDSLYMCHYTAGADIIGKIKAFPINDQLLNTVDPEVAEKMRWFAKGFYTVDKIGDKIRIYNLQVDMRGIVNDGEKEVPTVGYFELENIDGTTVFNSGSIQ